MSLKATLRNLDGGLATVERHTGTLVGDIEKLRESHHNLANGISRVEGTLVELRDTSDADGRAIGELQHVVGDLSDRVATLSGSIQEMLARFDAVMRASSIKPEPPSAIGFAAPEETTNPGLRHGER